MTILLGRLTVKLPLVTSCRLSFSDAFIVLSLLLFGIGPATLIGGLEGLFATPGGAAPEPRSYSTPPASPSRSTCQPVCSSGWSSGWHRRPIRVISSPFPHGDHHHGGRKILQSTPRCRWSDRRHRRSAHRVGLAGFVRLGRHGLPVGCGGRPADLWESIRKRDSSVPWPSCLSR